MTGVHNFIFFTVFLSVFAQVIDETWNVLRLLTDTDTSSSLPRTQEALQELRDLSSMAMEHFDEKVAPALKQKSAIRRFSVYCGNPLPSFYFNIFHSHF